MPGNSEPDQVADSQKTADFPGITNAFGIDQEKMKPAFRFCSEKNIPVGKIPMKNSGRMDFMNKAGQCLDQRLKGRTGQCHQRIADLFDIFQPFHDEITFLHPVSFSLFQISDGRGSRYASTDKNGGVVPGPFGA